MSKSLHKVALKGLVGSTSNIAKTSDASKVYIFTSENNLITIERFDHAHGDRRIRVKTKNGSHILEKHAKLNYYHCVANGVKIQVTMRKIVAELRYWA